MFNSYNVSNPQNVSINAVGGTIVKNYKKSFIMRFHMNSAVAKSVLDKIPRLDKRPIVVLQVMICGEKELLAELMWEEDFNKLYEPQTKESEVD